MTKGCKVNTQACLSKKKSRYRKQGNEEII